MMSGLNVIIKMSMVFAILVELFYKKDSVLEAAKSTLKLFICIVTVMAAT